MALTYGFSLHGCPLLREARSETRPTMDFWARLGQPDGISPSRMAEMLEVDKAGPKVRC
jgi:hypothetical protein